MYLFVSSVGFLHILLFINSDGCWIFHSNAHCQNLSLTELPLGLGYVTNLNISFNFLSYLNAKYFEIYENILTIDATENNITFIEAGTFFRHSELKYLAMERNMLSVFNASTIFVPNSKLQTLIVKQNRLVHIDVMSLKNLKLLNIEANLINQIELSISNMESLEELHFGNNYLEKLLLPQSCCNLTSHIKLLDIHDNQLKDILFLTNCSFSSLVKLNLARNNINYLLQDTFLGLNNLNLLILDGNPLMTISGFAFNGLNQLNNLHLNDLSKLQHVLKDAFENLTNVNHLELRQSRMLANIHYRMSRKFTKLQFLDLSNNNLANFDIRIFKFLRDLKVLNLSNNNWICDCSIILLNEMLIKKMSCGLIIDNFNFITCKFFNESNEFLFSKAIDKLNCSDGSSTQMLQEKELFFVPGSTAKLDCGIMMDSKETNYMWMKVSQRKCDMYFEFDNQNVLSMRQYISSNGSLVIENIESSDLGHYECYDTQCGSLKEIILLKFNFGILAKTEFMGMVVGLITSASFLLFAILFAGIRTCCKLCSQKEKQRKTSMRETLNALRMNFQSDRFQNYKSVQIERLTAFRSATLEQISAFKSAKVNRLRKYKQASVNGVLHCLDKMRIHYSNQSMKIKTNCQQQFERLRESYIYQKTRFKDNRSQQVKKISENYHSQALRIKGYSVHQMSRLRDEYKSQQQNLMKLLELLEVGNCLNVIEADCSRTESMIFDSEIGACDLDNKSDNACEHQAYHEDDEEYDEDSVFELPPLLNYENKLLNEVIVDTAPVLLETTPSISSNTRLIVNNILCNDSTSGTMDL